MLNDKYSRQIERPVESEVLRTCSRYVWVIKRHIYFVLYILRPKRFPKPTIK